MSNVRLSDDRAFLAEAGVMVPHATEYLPEEWRNKSNGLSLAMDAQSPMITAPNAGIPSIFTTFIDPRQIKVVFAPTKGAEFYGEEKMGDWTTDQAMFPLTEIVGNVSAYGDFNQNGKSNANANWVSRQSFHFQTFNRWGERETERYGEGMVDWVALQGESSNQALNRALNKSYFFGVAGLKLYGGMNDPDLPTAISPNTKAAGGLLWASATALEVYNDFLKLYTQLQTQMPALVDMSSPMDLGLPNTLEPALAKTNDFGLTARQIIQQSFPNVNITVIPEFATASGNLLQLKLRDVDGLPVTKAAFTEKLRVHPVITLASGWEQKKSAGTWGTTIRYPIAITQMLGA